VSEQFLNGARARTHTHTHNHFMASLDYVRDNMGEPLPEETFTHSHLSWSSVIPYLLPPFIMIHGILPVEFTCLTIFFAQPLSKSSVLPLGLEPSTLYSIHFFTQSSSSFCDTYPYHHNLFCCSTENMSTIPSLSLNSSLNSIFYLNITHPYDHHSTCHLNR